MTVKAKHWRDQKSTATKVPRERKEERHRRYVSSVSFVQITLTPEGYGVG